MKYLNIVSILLLSVACSKARMDMASTVDFKQNNFLSAQSVQAVKNRPLTTVAYFYPEKESINWKNSEYNDSDSAEKKLEKISYIVADNGLSIDTLDQELRTAIINKETYGKIVDELLTKYDAIDCVDITDPIDLDTCTTNEEKRKTYQDQEDALQITKSERIDKIQLALDGRTSNTKNWIKIESTQTSFQIKPNDFGTEVKIDLFGRFLMNDTGWNYSSASGDIIDINHYIKTYTKGITGELTKLEFTIKERKSNGDFTGNFYKVSLNMSVVANLGVRYLGKIQMYNESNPSKLIREGKMKVMLPFE